MTSYILRLLEDRLEGGASTQATAPGNRMTYCVDGGISVDGGNLAANQVAFTATPCDLAATEGGAHLLRFELVAADGEDDGLLRGAGVTFSADRTAQNPAADAPGVVPPSQDFPDSALQINK